MTNGKETFFFTSTCYIFFWSTYFYLLYDLRTKKIRNQLSFFFVNIYSFFFVNFKLHYKFGSPKIAKKKEPKAPRTEIAHKGQHSLSLKVRHPWPNYWLQGYNKSLSRNSLCVDPKKKRRNSLCILRLSIA